MIRIILKSIGNIKDIEWVTSTGRHVKLGDMPSEHINRVIRILGEDRRKSLYSDPYHNRTHDQWKELFFKELERRWYNK
jgi:hypothetical protein